MEKKLAREGMPRRSRPKVRITMMMDPGLKVGLEDMAADRGTRYQTLAQGLLGDSYAAWKHWQEADARGRMADVGFLLRQVLDRLEEFGDAPPDVQACADEVARAVRFARRAIRRTLREAPRRPVVYVSSQEVEDQERRILERAARDPEAPLVEER